MTTFFESACVFLNNTIKLIYEYNLGYYKYMDKNTHINIFKI